MAKMYYNMEEAMARLGCTEEQLKGMVRAGKLREFRDAGKLNYRVDEVDKLGATTGENVLGHDSGSMPAEDLAEIALSPADSGVAPAPGGSSSAPGLSGSDIPIDLSGSDTGTAAPPPSGSTSGVIALDESGAGTKAPTSGSTSGEIKLEDSGAGHDAMSLDEVDKGAVEGMKKDDTVITNIGISVFDDDDLEIAADPMAKTLVAGGEEHLGLDGSGGGSGLLDLTRESDDTSLGAELLEGIDMGDTGETVAQTAQTEVPEAEAAEEEPALPAAGIEPAVTMVPLQVGVVEAVSPAFTGLLAAGALVLFLAGAASLAVSISTDALPKPFMSFSEGQSFMILLGGAIVAGGLFALVGWLVGRAPSGPRAPKAPKDRKPKEKKGKAPKKGEAGPAAA